MHPASTRRLLLSVTAAVAVAALPGCGAQPDGAAPHSPAGAPTAAKSPVLSAANPPTTDPRLIAQRANVPVLCFHQIRDWRASDSPGDRGIITPPTVLARQIDQLARAGFTPITDDALYAHLTTGSAPPPKPILLTFDDGSESQVANALPILERHHFPATFFVMTVVLDKQNWITRQQVKALPTKSVTIGSHTYDHHAVTGYYGTVFQVQLVQPRELLSRIVGRPVTDFAYPYGSWRHSSLPHVRAAGYRMAFGLDTAADSTDPLHSYPRRIVPPTWTEPQLLAAVARAAHPTSIGAEGGGD
ncbi:MAG TPA: polysaccharide deacetylase family protein [Frankiaceae bacterium]|nr:polysaccharide deacetylase family protein [Frankiaceae bacterium]